MKLSKYLSMAIFLLITLICVEGSSRVCTEKDCREQNMDCRTQCRIKWVTRILPTQASKPPGWLGIDCTVCRGYFNSKYRKVRYHCKYGCQPNGLKPPFFTKVTIPPTTKIGTSTNSKRLTTKRTTSTPTLRTTLKRTMRQRLIFGKNNTLRQEKLVDSRRNHLSFLWVLSGILAACVILIGFFLAFTSVWKRLSGGLNNKIGISDVIIHKSADEKKTTLYVIS